MALIANRYRCPACSRLFTTYKEAKDCRDRHPVQTERWAVGKDGKEVRISENCSYNGAGGEKWALREADLSDFIGERKKQLEEMEREASQPDAADDGG